MKMTFPASISKEEIQKLPLLTFKGSIHLIDNRNDVSKAVKKLEKHECLGFDTEKKPTFQKGAYHPTALVQLCSLDEAYLFRLNQIGPHPALFSLMTNPNIGKVGVGIRDDIEDLKKLRPFDPGGFVELINLTKELGIKNAGVRNLSGIFLEKRVSKNQQTSNWENHTLSKAQQLYASADAWVPLRIYTILQEQGYVYDK
jgi:ribonuclease D